LERENVAGRAKGPVARVPTIPVITHATATRKQVRQNEKRGQRARCRKSEVSMRETASGREREEEERENERANEEGRKTR